MPIAESSLALILATTVAMLSAVAAAAMPDAATAAQGLVLMDDSRLRLICIAGSLGGAVLSVMLFTVTNHQELARKLTCSSISGVVFSPILIRYFNVSVTTDYVLVVSAVTALLSWGILQTVIPIANKKITEKLTGQGNGPPTPPVN